MEVIRNTLVVLKMLNSVQESAGLTSYNATDDRGQSTNDDILVSASWPQREWIFLARIGRILRMQLRTLPPTVSPSTPEDPLESYDDAVLQTLLLPLLV